MFFFVIPQGELHPHMVSFLSLSEQPVPGRLLLSSFSRFGEGRAGSLSLLLCYLLLTRKTRPLVQLSFSNLHPIKYPLPWQFFFPIAFANSFSPAAPILTDFFFFFFPLFSHDFFSISLVPYGSIPPKSLTGSSCHRPRGSARFVPQGTLASS